MSFLVHAHVLDLNSGTNQSISCILSWMKIELHMYCQFCCYNHWNLFFTCYFEWGWCIILFIKPYNCVFVWFSCHYLFKTKYLNRRRINHRDWTNIHLLHFGLIDKIKDVSQSKQPVVYSQFPLVLILLHSNSTRIPLVLILYLWQ
jgi:hypothetical protein